MGTPKTILVGMDFSEPARAALDYAVDLARKLEARVHVVHAFEIPMVGLPMGMVTLSADLAKRLVDDAEAALATLRGEYAARGVTISTSIEQADPRDGLIEAAKKAGADLIVVGTQGRRGLARMLIGSVAEGVVRRSPVPVLSIHLDRTGASS